MQKIALNPFEDKRYIIKSDGVDTLALEPPSIRFGENGKICISHCTTTKIYEIKTHTNVVFLFFIQKV